PTLRRNNSLGWHGPSFLIKPQWPIRGGGNNPCWHCQTRDPCTASRHRICARPRAATRPPRRRAWPRIFVVGCSLPCDPPFGGHVSIAQSVTKADRQVARLESIPSPCSI